MTCIFIAFLLTACLSNQQPVKQITPHQPTERPSFAKPSITFDDWLTAQPSVRQCSPIIPANTQGLRYQAIKARIKEIWYVLASPPEDSILQTLEDLKSYAYGLKGEKIDQWQGWVLQVENIGDGNSWATIDMDEYAGDPLFLVSEYEGIRRIGLPDVILTELSYEMLNTLQVGSPVVFSGTIYDIGNLDNVWLNEWLVPTPVPFNYWIPRPEVVDRLTTDPAIARLLFIVSPTEVQPPDIKHNCTMIGTRTLIITLTRPHCWMTSSNCYTESITIYGDGEILYTKRYWSSTDVITKTTQIDETEIQRLVYAFEQTGYFALKDDYDSYDVSEASSATTSITLNGRRKSVFHYHGDMLAPADILKELEETIEKVANIEQFQE